MISMVVGRFNSEMVRLKARIGDGKGTVIVSFNSEMVRLKETKTEVTK